MSAATLTTLLGCFVTFAKGYKKAKPVIPVIKYGLIILIGSYVLKWLGFI